MTSPRFFTDFEVETIAQAVKDGKSSRDIGESLGCSGDAILRIVRKRNLGPWQNVQNRPEQQSRQMPADFPELAERMTNAELIAHYGCSGSKPTLWRKQAGLLFRPVKNRIKTPADFLTYAPGKTVEELCHHYRFSADTVRRMRDAHGIVTVRAKPQGRPKLVNNAYQTTPIVRVSRDVTTAGQACDYLRKFGPIWRCNQRGGPEIGGYFWRRGSAILTDAELIERAESLGWDRDEWRRVKAA